MIFSRRQKFDPDTQLIIESCGGCTVEPLFAYILKHNPDARLAGMTYKASTVIKATRAGIPCAIVDHTVFSSTREIMAERKKSHSKAMKIISRFYNDIHKKANQDYVYWTTFEASGQYPFYVVEILNGKFLLGLKTGGEI